MIEIDSFKERQVAFANISEVSFKNASDKAKLYLKMYLVSSVSDEKSLILEELMICHLLTLEERGSDIVGIINSANAGSISTSFETFSTDNNSNARWLHQTQYGALFFQLTKVQGYARYYA